MGRMVYRLLLAVVALLLLAIPALGQTGDPKVSKLDIRPEIVWVGEDGGQDVYFDAAINSLKTTGKVYLTFQKEGSNSALQVELRYNDGLWTGKKAVGNGDVGTWKLVYCSYRVDDETGILDLDGDNSAIETRFTVKEGAGPDIVELDVHPETVTVAADGSKNIYFDAAIDNLDTAGTVYLTFRKEGATAALQAELTYEDGLWTGKKTVDDGDIGTWKLVGCSYKLDDQTGSIAFDAGDPDIDTRFTVKKQAVVTPPNEDEDEDSENGDDTYVPGLCKPKQLRATLVCDEDGKTNRVNLAWQLGTGNNASEFKIYAGYSAGHMIQVGTVEGKLNCTLNLDDVIKALQAQNKPKGKKHVLFRVGNSAGFSNVAVVPLKPGKIKAGKGQGKWAVVCECPYAKVKWNK